MVEPVAHGARDGQTPPIVGQQEEHAGAGTQPVQRLVNGGRNRVCRGSGVTEGRARLRQTMGLRGRALGGHAADRSRLIVLSTQTASSPTTVQVKTKNRERKRFRRQR